MLEENQGLGCLPSRSKSPKGSRNKLKYDPVKRMYKLLKVMPEGMVFPCDLSSTLTGQIVGHRSLGTGGPGLGQLPVCA